MSSQSSKQNSKSGSQQSFYEEFGKAIESLQTAIELLKKSYHETPQLIEMHKALRDACIQRFEFCVELAWKTSMRTLGLDVKSPNPGIREMARNNLIDDTQIWFDFLVARNKTSHTYDEEVAKEVYLSAETALPHFNKLLEKLKVIAK